MPSGAWSPQSRARARAATSSATGAGWIRRRSPWPSPWRRAQGAEVLTFTHVKQILVEGGRVAGVATDAGLIHAPIVVDAAGPWAGSLARTAGVDLPISGARG